MAHGPMHERSLREQWMHAIFAPRHLWWKAGIVFAFVLCILPPHARDGLVTGAVQIAVTIGMVYIGFGMILGTLRPKGKKKKGDH